MNPHFSLAVYTYFANNISGVCLVIPDLYDKRHVKEMIHILMVEMRFKAILLHQESVCATFGAGLTTACVVDIGHDRYVS